MAEPGLNQHDGRGDPAQQRLLAIDMARGLAMLLVVAMHSILGVEEAFQQTGALHHLVAFATAFRVPAFFLISGLFLRRAMRLGWRDLFMKRIAGLILLYLLWLAIHASYRAIPAIVESPVAGLFGAEGLVPLLLRSLIEPYGTLWFVHLMIVFILLARMVFAIGLPLPLAIGLGVLLETARISTGWTLIDEFSARLVFFLIGLWLAPFVLPGGRAAHTSGKGPVRNASAHPLWFDRVLARPRWMLVGLASWLLVQALLVRAGLDHARGISLVAGLAGAAAMIGMSGLVAVLWPASWLERFLTVIGQRSIVIYLFFTIPMGIARTLLHSLTPTLPVDLAALAVIAAALAASLLVERVARRGWLNWIFSRHVFGEARTPEPR